MEVWPGIPLVWDGNPVRTQVFLVLGVFQGLEGSGKGRGLDCSVLVVESGRSEDFSRGPPILGRGSH